MPISYIIQNSSPYFNDGNFSNLADEYSKNIMMNRLGQIYFGYISGTSLNNPTTNQHNTISMSGDGGQTWTQKVNTTVLAASILYSSPYVIRADSYTHYFNAFVAGTLHGKKDIEYCTIWHELTSFNNSDYWCVSGQCCIDSNDTMNLIINHGASSGDPHTGEIWLLTNTENTWGIPEAIRAGDGYGHRSDVFIDASNNIHVFYTKSTDSYSAAYCKYRARINGTWGSVETVFSGSYSMGITSQSIIVDSDGNIHFAWSTASAFNPWPTILYYRVKKSDTSWEIATTIVNGTVNLYYPSGARLSLDLNNNIYLSWNGKDYGTYTTKQQIIYRRRLSGLGSWDSDVLVTNENINHKNIAQLGNKKFPYQNIPTSGCAGVYSTGSLTYYSLSGTPIIYYWKSDDFQSQIAPPGHVLCLGEVMIEEPLNFYTR